MLPQVKANGRVPSAERVEKVLAEFFDIVGYHAARLYRDHGEDLPEALRGLLTERI
jgi:hypothetical protein